MAAFCLVSSWRFVLSGIGIDLTGFKLPKENLDCQAADADRPYGESRAHRCYRLQVMQLVIGNEREYRQPDRGNDEKADDLAAMTGCSAFRCLA